MTKLAVHSGVFHADDVFGVAFMEDTIEGLEIIRTRDESILAQCDIVADVGGGKYDHHQADKKLREDGIPYCAFGLLWQDYGKAYIQKNFPDLEDEGQQQEVLERVAYEFITQIDAADNGVDINHYEIPITTLNSVINSFMPFGGTQEEVEEGFSEAVSFAKKLFHKQVRKCVGFYHDKNYVAEQLTEQPVAETHYMVFDHTLGWKEPLLELDVKEDVWFVVFEDISGSWRVQTVPKEAGNFAARYDLPSEWAGLRDEDFSKATQVEGGIFCHPGLFICGNQTKEGAIALAKLAVGASNKN